MSLLKKVASLTIALPLSLANLSSQSAEAQSLQDKMKQLKKVENTELHVGCGVLDKANCSVVVPELAQKVPSNVRLKPEETTGSGQSAEAVCLGLAQVAIGQADTFNKISRTPDCAGKVETVGVPVYPYYGYMIVRADRKYDKFSDMISQRNNKALRIAAGSEGSGGHDTLQAIKNFSPSYNNAVSRENGSGQTALDRVLDGALDAFFVMDGADSEFIRSIKGKVDKNGNALFKFIAMDLDSNFYYNQNNRFGEYQLYTEESFKIDGWWFSTKTVSVGAVALVNKDFRGASDANGKAISAVRQGTIDAAATIRELTKTPESWAPRPAGR